MRLAHVIAINSHHCNKFMWTFVLRREKMIHFVFFIFHIILDFSSFHLHPTRLSVSKWVCLSSYLSYKSILRQLFLVTWGIWNVFCLLEEEKSVEKYTRYTMMTAKMMKMKMKMMITIMFLIFTNINTDTYTHSIVCSVTWDDAASNSHTQWTQCEWRISCK